MIRTRRAERSFDDREPTHLEAERERAATLEGWVWRMTPRAVLAGYIGPVVDRELVARVTTCRSLDEGQK